MKSIGVVLGAALVTIGIIQLGIAINGESIRYTYSILSFSFGILIINESR